MSSSEPPPPPSKTVIFCNKMNKFWAFVGVHNVWIEDIYAKKIHKIIHKIVTLSILIFIILEYGALFTQNNLTDKQSNDVILFAFAHPIVSAYYVGFEYHKAKIKVLLITLHIKLKILYNDPAVEAQMIKKAFFFSMTYLVCLSVSLTSYGFDAIVQVLRGGTFTTIITMWPDVEDRSSLANVVRACNYIIWWVFVYRVSAVSTFTIMTSIALSHQYKNLQSYFYSLSDIFESSADDLQYYNEMEQIAKETKYIEALKVGIKLHSVTLWCVKQCQLTCNLVYSGQILINIFVLCLLMLQMMDTERTLVNTLTILCTSIAILAASGLFMLNAGDIIVQAALLPTAMYSSGWENCHGTASARARRLLVIAMMQAQRPVCLRSYGIVDISYESFLSIVKSSYSIFSVLY